jgi:hypothetical protein
MKKKDLTWFNHPKMVILWNIDNVIMPTNTWHTLVGGFNHSKKYERQLGLLFPIYGKIKFMFQTTNHYNE